MTFEKVVEALRQGKKAYRRAWESNIIMALDSKNKIRYWIEDDDNHYGIEFTLDGKEIFADDWEICEEPEPEEREITPEDFGTRELLEELISRKALHTVYEPLDEETFVFGVYYGKICQG